VTDAALARAIAAVVDRDQARAGKAWGDLAIAHAYLDYDCPPALGQASGRRAV
jgi:hypothetical protein